MKRPSAELLLSAYVQGIFPMAHPEADDEIFWYAPDPRAIIPLDEFHASRRLRQIVRKGVFEIKINADFVGVMNACAAPRDTQESTWISSGIIDSYVELHHLGFAHSVEAWQDGELVGGLYGVGVGGLFAGESMFHRATNASKVCLYHLVEHMKARGMTLLDIQFVTDHLAKFGAVEVTKDEYERQLQLAVTRPVNFVDGAPILVAQPDGEDDSD